MSPFNPEDLNGKDASTICRELFGVEPEDEPWWSLEREDEQSFRWTDKYLGINWRAAHGYLVALHEVSTPNQAAQFAAKNRLHLFEDGGLYFKGHGVAELFIRCAGIPPREEVRKEEELYRLRFHSGTVAKIGFGSMLFRRLVAGPAAEVNPSLPDQRTIPTLVLSNVERTEVPSFADLALYHFRNYFKGLKFAFSRLSDLHLAPGLEESRDVPDPPRLLEDLEVAARPEAISFFNRAKESGTIPGFLYFYRVLEACFDDVIDKEVNSWRCDEAIDCTELMKRIRKLQSDREDKWALRQVLGKIVSQPLLDEAQERGLIVRADADMLSQAIYDRRNSIAHGRRGQHKDILVPYGFSSGDSGQHDRSWYDLMEKLATKALQEWVLSMPA